MNTRDTWELVESKIEELRIYTEANWKHSEWELAALGERVIRTAENARLESEKLRTSAQALQQSMEKLKKQYQYQVIFADQTPAKN
jgi:hypothetical protein